MTDTWRVKCCIIIIIVLTLPQMEQQDGRPLATLRARLRRPKLTPVSLISMLFAGRMLPPDTAADRATVEHSSGACTWRLALLLLLLLLNSLAQPQYTSHTALDSRIQASCIIQPPILHGAVLCSRASMRTKRPPQQNLFDHPTGPCIQRHLCIVPGPDLRGEGRQALLRSSPAR